MPAARQANNLEAAGVHFRDAQGNFVGFSARVDKDNFIQRCRQQADQSLCQLKNRLGKHPGVEVDDFIERLLHSLDDARMIVTNRRANLARGEIQDALSVLCFEPCARGTRHDKRGKTTRITDQKALAFVGHLSFLSGQVVLIVPLRAANSLLQANKWSAVAAGLCADCRWKAMIETKIQRLVVLPECGPVLSPLRRTILLNDEPSREIRNQVSFTLSHHLPGYIY